MPIVVPYPPSAAPTPGAGADDLLAAGREAVESLMSDTCTLRAESDPDGWALGADLRLTPGAGAALPIYEGPFSFRPSQVPPAQVVVGDDPAAEVLYEVGLPLSAPKLAVGQTIEVTSCLRDPSAVGMVMTVIQPTYKTMTVKRRALAKFRGRVQ